MADKETRAGKLGRNFGGLVRYIIGTVPAEQRDEYRTRFLREFEKYSFEPRRNGEPRNSGCVHELEGIHQTNPRSPEELAKLLKEMLHMQYQKQTSFNAWNGLSEDVTERFWTEFFEDVQRVVDPTYPTYDEDFSI